MRIGVQIEMRISVQIDRNMHVSEAHRLKELEKENSHLKRLLAERDLEVDTLKEYLFERTAGGTKLKILTIGDDHTRECHAIEVGTSMRSETVIAVLARLVGEHGAPTYLRSDNRPEFIAHAVRAWLAGRKTLT